MCIRCRHRRTKYLYMWQTMTHTEHIASRNIPDLTAVRVCIKLHYNAISAGSVSAVMYSLVIIRDHHTCEILIPFQSSCSVLLYFTSPPHLCTVPSLLLHSTFSSFLSPSAPRPRRSDLQRQAVANSRSAFMKNV